MYERNKRLAIFLDTGEGDIEQIMIDFEDYDDILSEVKSSVLKNKIEPVTCHPKPVKLRY